MDYTIIGKNIENLRNSKNMRQEEFAKILGTSRPTVSNWEQGINRPDADILAQICLILNVSPSEILNVHISEEEYSEHEKALVRSYREKAELRSAVDLLLGIADH